MPTFQFFLGLKISQILPAFPEGHSCQKIKATERKNISKIFDKEIYSKLKMISCSLCVFISF